MKRHNLTPKEIVQNMWRRACAHDKINPKASFVVFSKDNPWEARYNLAMEQYLFSKRSIAVWNE